MRLRKFIIAVFMLCQLFLLQRICNAQELYIHTEPASNIPKNVIGVKAATEYYRQNNYNKHHYGLRLMYGVTAKWMFMLTGNLSNYYNNSFPDALFDNTIDYTSATKNYGYIPESLTLSTKYRIYSSDEMNKHLRIGLFADYSYSGVKYFEAEPSLMGSNSGIGAGMIITKLAGKLAVSATTGFVAPQWLNVSKTDYRFKSGNAFTYSLSAGYLLYPKTYKDYRQTNVNIYVECIGKIYEKARLKKQNTDITLKQVPFLDAGNYLDLRPAIQFIFNSNLRLDLSATALKFASNNEKKYTMVFLALQYYIIPGKRG